MCLADRAFSAQEYGMANEPLAKVINVFTFEYRDACARWLVMFDQGARI